MSRYVLAVLVILAPLLLGGCVGGEFLARALTDAAYLQGVAGEYTREIHALRQLIRQECKASLMREVETLRKAGDEAALRELLAKSYPDLVTVGVVKAAGGDGEGALSRAPGCG